MKRFVMLALTAGSIALAVPAFAQTTVPRDTGGSPGNGQAVVNGMHDTGGTPGNGQAAVNGEHDTGGTPGNGQAATSGERDQGGTPGNGKAKAHK